MACSPPSANLSGTSSSACGFKKIFPQTKKLLRVWSPAEGKEGPKEGPKGSDLGVGTGVLGLAVFQIIEQVPLLLSS